MLPTLLLALALHTATAPAALDAGERQILWTDPRPATLADWIWGPGGEARCGS